MKGKIFVAQKWLFDSVFAKGPFYGFLAQKIKILNLFFVSVFAKEWPKPYFNIKGEQNYKSLHGSEDDCKH